MVEEITTKEMVKNFRSAENANEDVCAVIIKVDNKKFGTTTKSYNIDLLGKTMTEWVANSVFDAKISYGEMDFADDFLPVAKRCADPNYKYTFVLFSDAPLFERKTYLQILEYFKLKKLSVLKLTRGYVFETDYLLKIDSLLSPQTQYFEEEDFMVCYSLKQTSMVRDVLKNRILNYFMTNGVNIVDPATTVVEADAQIEKDVLVHPMVSVLGNTIIESGASIGTGTILENSIVCAGTETHRCGIYNSFVGKNCKIGENSIIKNNAKIEDGVAIPPNCIVDGVVVKKEDKLKSFVNYFAKEN
jgi:hypothetical protein